MVMAAVEKPAVLEEPKTVTVTKTEINALSAAEIFESKTDAGAAYIAPAEEMPTGHYMLEVCIETLLVLLPKNCHMTLRHPDHENIQVEIDGAILANPITVNLEKVSGVFGAINILQEVMQ
jgi:hypothetical protein